MGDSKGMFSWYDVVTTDVDAARAFYTEVIGWKTQEWGGPTPYTMFTAGGHPIGGVMELPERARAQGAPPHIRGYVSVPDAEASTRKVVELGGKVLTEVTDIPEVGRFSVIADPQGAPLSLFQSATADSDRRDEVRPGVFTWHELYTTDYEAAFAFYRELFGWKHTESMDMGEMGTYFMFERPGSTLSRGGMSNVAKHQGFPPHWLFYVSVGDLEAAIERATSRGAELLMGPMEVPGGDRIAQLHDPQGAHFALHSPKQ